MSSDDTNFYVLNNTGVLYIENGFHHREILKKHGVFFLPHGEKTVSCIPQRAWVVKHPDDAAIRTFAQQLRKIIKSSGDFSIGKVCVLMYVFSCFKS